MIEIWQMHEYHAMFRWVVFIGDTHIGHTRFNEKRLRAIVRKVARSQSYRVVLMGDYLEMATKNKMRIEQELNTNVQLDKFLDIIDPIKDQVIAVLRGNHEERITAIDYVRSSLMPHLPNAVYLGYDGFIRVGNNKFPDSVLYLHHGDGGSANPAYYIEQKLFKVGVQAVADVIAVGHLHVNWDDTYYIPTVVDNSVVVRPVLCFRTGSFLDDAEYARRAAFRIAQTKTPRYDLNRRTIDYV